MKRIVCVLLAMAILSGGTAFAEELRVVLDGKVIPGGAVTVLAPFGGQVEDFALRAGDVAQKGDALLSLSTTKVYAPEDGWVKGLRIQAGDATDFIQGKYEALLYIEPKSPFVIETSVSEAYDDDANRIVHVGETVYLRSVNSYSRTGEGFVTKVDGKEFSVEVTSGNLRFDESASIHREETFKSASRIGRGRTKRNPDTAITGEGSVLAVHVTEGQEVKRGELLFETVTGTLPELAGMGAVITAPIGGAVAGIEVKAGDTVKQDQVLLSIYPEGAYQIMAAATEIDLYKLSVGATVEIEFTMARENASIKGTIAAISAINGAESGDAEYAVYIDFENTPQIREGMSVSVRVGG